MVRADLAQRFTMTDLDFTTGGRALRAGRRDQRPLGFITPLTHNFCEACNRVRLTCTGTLYMCLGQEGRRRPARAAARQRATSFWSRRSTGRSRASPRATTSSSTAAAARPPWRGMSVTGG